MCSNKQGQQRRAIHLHGLAERVNREAVSGETRQASEALRDGAERLKILLVLLAIFLLSS